MQTDYLEYARALSKIEESIKLVIQVNTRLGTIFSSLAVGLDTINFSIEINKEELDILKESLNYDFSNSGDKRQVISDIINKLNNLDITKDKLMVSLSSKEIFETLRVTRFYHYILRSSKNYVESNYIYLVDENSLNAEITDILDKDFNNI